MCLILHDYQWAKPVAEQWSRQASTFSVKPDGSGIQRDRVQYERTAQTGTCTRCGKSKKRYLS